MMGSYIGRDVFNHRTSAYQVYSMERNDKDSECELHRGNFSRNRTKSTPPRYRGITIPVGSCYVR